MRDKERSKMRDSKHSVETINNLCSSESSLIQGYTNNEREIASQQIIHNKLTTAKRGGSGDGKKP